ncbi:MAG: hydantoinase B/oxoprolinase family protein, partial [Pseudomonadota bacterium]
AMPIAFTEKELMRGTGGKGRSVGGDGQRIGFKMRSGHEWLLNAIPSRLSLPAQGLDGGAPGASGAFLINGESTLPAAKKAMGPDDAVLMLTPGGGGYGAPST